jgi:hypothetical protein
VDTRISSDEESEAEVGEEEEESDDEFCEERKGQCPSGRYWPLRKRYGHSFANN